LCWVPASRLGLSLPDGSLAFQDLVARHALSPIADRTPPLHPTQLYEAAGELAIFALLITLAGRPRPRGALLALYLGLYGALRLGIELFRGDAARRYLVQLSTPSLNRALGLGDGPALLSTSQAASLVALGCALALALKIRRSRPSPASP
jgi:phosphatidylglycerol:prolipoprotein diacylglycerol transferase